MCICVGSVYVCVRACVCAGRSCMRVLPGSKRRKFPPVYNNTFNYCFLLDIKFRQQLQITQSTTSQYVHVLDMTSIYFDRTFHDVSDL